MSKHSIDSFEHNLELQPKLRGELAELAFMYRASREGIAVAKPYGDSHPFDFLVQHGSRLLRIQVKSTFKNPNGKRRYGFQVIVARTASKGITSYSSNEIDFIAAFIAPLDLWYVIPVEELGRRHAIRLYPQGKGQPFGGLYEKYRDAWNLLKDEALEDDSSCTERSTSSFQNGSSHAKLVDR